MLVWACLVSRAVVFNFYSTAESIKNQCVISLAAVLCLPVPQYNFLHL